MTARFFPIYAGYTRTADFNCSPVREFLKRMEIIFSRSENRATSPTIPNRNGTQNIMNILTFPGLQRLEITLNHRDNTAGSPCPYGQITMENMP